MTAKGINFAEQTSIYRRKERRQQVTKNLSIAGGILGLCFLAYGGVFLYKTLQENKLANLQSQIETEKQSRNFKDLAEIVDTTTRLNFLRDFSKNQLTWSNFLHEIEGKMIGSAYLVGFNGAASPVVALETASNGDSSSALSNAEEMIELSFMVDSLSNISKQIMLLEESDKIKEIYLGNIELGEAGLAFTLNLQLTPDALLRSSYAAQSNYIPPKIEAPAPVVEETTTTEETTTITEEEAAGTTESTTTEADLNATP